MIWIFPLTPVSVLFAIVLGAIGVTLALIVWPLTLLLIVILGLFLVSRHMTRKAGAQ